MDMNPRVATRAGIAAVLGIAVLAGGWIALAPSPDKGVWRAADTTGINDPAEPTGSGNEYGAASVEEVARRLSDFPLNDTTTAFDWDSPCDRESGSTDRTALSGVPVFSARFVPAGEPDTEFSVSAAVLPDRAAAESVAARFGEGLSACPTVVDDYPGDGHGSFETGTATNSLHVRDGWQGTRQLKTGFLSMDNEWGLRVEDTVHAQRGVLFVSIETVNFADQVGEAYGQPGAASRDATVETTNRLLDTLGEPDPAVDGPVPDPDSGSNVYSPGLPGVEVFHPAAGVTGATGLDLTCDFHGDDSAVDPEYGYIARGTGADVTATDDILDWGRGPVDAVSATEILSFTPDDDTAAALADDVRESVGHEKTNSSFGAADSEPIEISEWPCADQGPDVTIDRENDDWTDFEEDGWTGQLRSGSVALSTSTETSSTEESVVRLQLVAQRGPVVGYLRFQTGGGADPEAAIARGTGILREVLAGYPDV